MTILIDESVRSLIRRGWSGDNHKIRCIMHVLIRYLKGMLGGGAGSPLISFTLCPCDNPLVPYLEIRLGKVWTYRCWSFSTESNEYHSILSLHLCLDLNFKGFAHNAYTYRRNDLKRCPVFCKRVGSTRVLTVLRMGLATAWNYNTCARSCGHGCFDLKV